MENTKQRKELEICLCSVCASPLYHANHKEIHRVDPLQVCMDLCDYCRTRRGYDFVITPCRKQIRAGFKTNPVS